MADIREAERNTRTSGEIKRCQMYSCVRSTLNAVDSVTTALLRSGL